MSTEIPVNGQSITCTGPPSTITIQAPQEPLLQLRINEDGKLDAIYDPEKLTDAALALMAYIDHLQGGQA